MHASRYFNTMWYPKKLCLTPSLTSFNTFHRQEELYKEAADNSDRYSKQEKKTRDKCRFVYCICVVLLESQWLSIYTI